MISNMYEDESSVLQYFSSITTVGVLTCYALLHSVCDLKDAQMNV